MVRKTKKLLSVLFSILLVLTLLPVNVLAAESTQTLPEESVSGIPVSGDSADTSSYDDTSAVSDDEDALTGVTADDLALSSTDSISEESFAEEELVGLDYYRLYIGGIQISSESLYGVIDGLSYLYDPDENTLHISGEYVPYGSYEYGIINEIDGLTLELDEDVTMRAPSDRNFMFISAMANMTITGARTLELIGDETNSHEIKGIYVTGGAVLTVLDADIKIGQGVDYGLKGYTQNGGAGLEVRYPSTVDIEAAAAAVLDFTGGIFLNGTCFVTPFMPGGYAGGGTIKDCYGQAAVHVVIGSDPYFIGIDDVMVTESNKDDVLGDGVFAYDPDTQTLTVNDSYTGVSSVPLIDNYVDGLTIMVTKPNCYLQLRRLSYINPSVPAAEGVIVSHGDITFKSEHYGDSLRLSATDWDISGIIMKGATRLSFDRADLEIESVIYGLKGEDGASLFVEHSWLDIDSYTKAVTMFDNGIDLLDCYIYHPEGGIVYDNEVQSGGTAAEYVRIVPGNSYFMNHVFFDSNGHGEDPPYQYLDYGMTAEEPAVTSDDGCIFAGWYLDPGCTLGPFDFNTPIKEDITLYALWAYPLWVGETQVTDANKEDILGDGSTVYNPETKTLLFASEEPDISGLHERRHPLNSCDILTMISADGIDLTIDAPYGLVLNSDEGYGVFVMNGHLTIMGNVTANTYGSSIWAYQGLSVEGDTDVTSTGTDYAVYSASMYFTGNVRANGYDCALYGRGIHITGDAELSSLTGGGIFSNDDIRVEGNVTANASGSALFARTSLAVTGSVEANVTDCEMAICSTNGGVTADGTVNVHVGEDADYGVYAVNDVTLKSDVTVDGNVVTGIYSAAGRITIVSGNWDVSASGKAFDASTGITVPASHVITVPANGKAAKVGDRYHITESDDTTIAEHAVIVPTSLTSTNITSASANFAGKLVINTFMFLSDAVKEDPDAYVRVDFAGKTKKFMAADLLGKLDSQGRAKISQDVNAAQMRDDIVIRVYNGQDELQPLTYRVNRDVTEGYSFTMLDFLKAAQRTGDLKLKRLAIATEVYGIAAQVYFNYRTDQLTAREIADMKSQASEIVIPSTFAKEEQGTYPLGIQKRTESVLLEADNSLREYFYLNDADIAKYTFRIDSSKVKAAKKSSGKYYIQKKNIAAAELSKEYVFSVTYRSQTYAVKSSVLSYAYDIQQNSTDLNLINLVSLLYPYSQAAEAYFGS